MSLAPGTHWGPFEILAALGSGGMGEVYRAKDTKLKREVALKVLPDSFAADPERMARFQREAQMLASLNHPNIAQIYDVEDRAIVMELVEGETLSSPLPIETALNYARQMAEALEYAHERGVIHRDLKPANIKVTPEGTVKLLDFGLAKAIEDPAVSADNPEHSPTLTLGVTRVGVILGTAAYMSPEQANGKTADRRADIWGFGAVLYEMLSGKRAFAGESVSDTLASVLKADPDWNALPAETPASIRRLIQRCLTKDRKQRLQAIGEARIAVGESLSGASAENAEPVATHRLWLAWSVAGVLAVGLASVASLHFRERPPVPAARVRFQIPAPENTSLTGRLKLSPDGRKLAFLVDPGATSAGPVGSLRLWVHFMESGESRDLTAADGSPFWSPDSRFIGYPFQNKVRKIEATGGPPETVADFAGRWGAGAWNQDGMVVFGSSASLFRVPASGGVPIQITALDPARHEVEHSSPSFLPDGRHFVYIRQSTEREKSAIYLGSVDAKPEQQSSKPLLASSWGPVYAPSSDPRTGYLLFMRERALMAQPFDNHRMELTGQATFLAERVVDNNAGAGGYGAFSASANDVLVFQRAATLDQQLTWYNREGRALGTAGEPGEYPWGLALSPDGMRLAFSKKGGPTSSNIYLLDLARNTPTRFTFGSKIDSDPVWSPDGSRIIFSSNRDGAKWNMYQKQVSGVKDEEVLLKGSDDAYPTSWSRDGRFLLYEAMHPKAKFDIWVLPMLGDNKPVPFHTTEFSEGDARFSPDGRWVAYTSDESGRPEVYARSFSMKSGPAAVEPGVKSQISNGGGVQPRWRGDGRELFYYSLRDGKVMAVDIATTPALQPGTPRPLGAAPPLPPTWPGPSALWDFAADGKRFLAPADVSRPEPFTVVLNWQAGLKRVR